MNSFLTILANISDFSVYWSGIIDFAIIGLLVLLSNTLRRKVPFLRKYVIPTSIIAGFLGLGIKYLLANNLWQVTLGDPSKTLLSNEFMGVIAYHALAIGFIGSGLRDTSNDKKKGDKAGSTIKTGLSIVSNYLIQAVLGLIITVTMAAILTNSDIALGAHSGVLLALGFGQGPGQAGNTGFIFDSNLINAGLLETGGDLFHSFGLTISALGFLAACIPGIIYMNYLVRKKLIVRAKDADSVKFETGSIESPDEIPMTESVDKLTVQISFVLLTYFLAWALMFGVDQLGGAFLPSGVWATVSSLMWGFNFIFAILMAMLVKQVIKLLRKKKIMTRKYTNDFMLSRISGTAFDVMIVAALTSIDVKIFTDIGLVATLLLLGTVGGIVTFLLVNWQAKKWFPTYRYEAFFALYGTLTGTNSTGIGLLREIDPNFETPAANNLVNGAVAAVILGGPLLVAVGFVPRGGWWIYGTIIGLFIIFVLYMLLGNFYNRRLIEKSKLEKEKSQSSAQN
ncbi:MAG TPA: hypothetical protein VJZ05_00405 [Bacilli bacterium]|jgi:ESS family glutamate:Na+ symporter|nr:hypothetical protein [Bacilli bacterium]MDY0399886.1 hypothetical protein [Bacilli bacterium]HKM10814.1 hypothetical protein [Bacilli bacterium]